MSKMQVTQLEQQIRELELLAAKFHEVYQAEATRQRDVRHPNNFADLPENIKEFDRVLARYVLALVNEQVAGAYLAAAHKAGIAIGEALGHSVQCVEQVILEATPADAQKALAERDERVWREAMKAVTILFSGKLKVYTPHEIVKAISNLSKPAEASKPEVRK